MLRKLKKPWYGTINLCKGAKTSVRVFADIQNFALRACNSLGIPCSPNRPKTEQKVAVFAFLPEAVSWQVLSEPRATAHAQVMQLLWLGHDGY